MKAFLRSRRGAILIVVLIGLVLRMWAAFQLPLDYDEPVYLQNAFDYARFIRAGDINAVIDYAGTTEHPPLTRLLFSLTMLPGGKTFGWSEALLFARLISVFFGTLAVWVLALVDPLAGGLFAIQTYAVKYTSQAYLEAIPLFASLAALFALRYSKVVRDRWFWLSALALGLTAAGKYSYFPIFIVILYVYFFDKKYTWKDLFIYLGVAVVAFFILNPALWHDPLQRLVSSVFYHTQYAQSAHVKEIGYPWYQPIAWLASSKPFEWHPGVFFYNPAEGPFSVDGMIFLLALAGLYLQWRDRRYVIVWIVFSVIALLFWPTKWPQYILVVVPAFCLAAASALRWVIGYFRHLEDYYGWVSTMIPIPSTVVWLTLFAAVAFFGTFTAVTGFNIYMARQGWSHVLQGQTPLPSNQIYAITAMPDGRMAVGTAAGLVLWSAERKAEDTDQWQVITQSNSALPSDEILSLRVGPGGELWAGTSDGLARYDGQSWQTFDGQTVGLPSLEIHDLQFDSQGRLWLATASGAAVYDGQHWQSFTPENSGLGDRLVLALTAFPSSVGDIIYFGTSDGLYSLDTQTNTWEHLRPEALNRRLGGISDLMVDSQGRLWVATLGSGIFIWDGTKWQQYLLSNSDLPSNRVDQIAEVIPGVYWIGASFPQQPGGILARFDGKTWKRFESLYTGYSGGATVAVAQDPLGRFWFGTQTLGIDIFDPTRKKN